MLARKTNRKLVLCVPELLQCPVVETISGGGQSCMRGMQVSTVSSKFCVVQGTSITKNLSTLQNSKVSTFGSFLRYCINGASIGTASSGCVSKMATAIGRCPLRRFHCSKVDYQSACFFCSASIAMVCWTLHYAKRILETLFVHRFSHNTMPITNLFKVSAGRRRDVCGCVQGGGGMCGSVQGGGMCVGECGKAGCVWRRDVWACVGRGGMCVGMCGEEGCVWACVGRRDVCGNVWGGGMHVGMCGEEGCVWVSAGSRDAWVSAGRRDVWVSVGRRDVCGRVQEGGMCGARVGRRDVCGHVWEGGVCVGV